MQVLQSKVILIAKHLFFVQVIRLDLLIGVAWLVVEFAKRLGGKGRGEWVVSLVILLNGLMAEEMRWDEMRRSGS